MELNDSKREFPFVRIALSFLFVLSTGMLQACATAKEVEPPKLKCRDSIELEVGSEFDVDKWCKYDGSVYHDEVLTDKVQDHDISVFAESDKGLSQKTIHISVIKPESEVAVAEKPTPKPTKEPEKEKPKDEKKEEGKKEEEKKETPTPTPEATPTPTPVVTPVPTPVPTSVPTYVPTPVLTPVPQPVYIPHGTETFSANDYGSLEGALNGCAARLNSIGYGECYVNDAWDGYVLSY